MSGSYLSPDLQYLLQEFEEGILGYDLNIGTISILHQPESLRRLQNKNYALRLLKKTQTGEISDAEAFAQISDYVAIRSEDNDMYVKDLSILLLGFEKIGVRSILNGFPIIETKAYNFWADGFTDRGFKFEYNDSHYCINSDEDGLTGKSTQVYHAMGGFNIAYFYSTIVENISALQHESGFDLNMSDISALGKKGNSLEDLRLFNIMFKIANDFKEGYITRFDIGQKIRIYIKDENESPPRLDKELRDLCNARVHFRKNEEDTFGDVQGKWLYTTDMGFDGTYYYQDYEYFGVLKNVRAIWDPNWNPELEKVKFQ